jgi:hypothetical protein
MQEYLDNGFQLGWLFDSPNRRVYAHRPGKAVECLENPAMLMAILSYPAFVLDLAKFDIGLIRNGDGPHVPYGIKSGAKGLTITLLTIILV